MQPYSVPHLSHKGHVVEFHVDLRNHLVYALTTCPFYLLSMSLIDVPHEKPQHQQGQIYPLVRQGAGSLMQMLRGSRSDGKEEEELGLDIV